MILFLLVVLGVMALRSGRISVVAFVAFGIAHKVIGDSLSDVLYYWTAGAFDVAVMAIIAVFARPSRLAWGLFLTSCGALFLNAYGWWIWFNMQTPAPYDTAYQMLYVLAILIILRGDDAEHDSPNNGVLFFPATGRKSVATGCTLSKEGRT